MRFFAVLALVAVLAYQFQRPQYQTARTSCTPPAPLSIEKIVASSVLVRASDGSSGSGSVFRSKAGEYLILTAAHVMYDAQGPVVVSQSILRDGKAIGEYRTLADVLVASHPWRSYDIAVLKPRDIIFTNVVTFYLGTVTPAIGSAVVHCGSPRGAWLERSVTFGHITNLNRYRNAAQRYPLDFSTCTALPGSSGGGVFLASSGVLVGFIDEWEGVDNVNFFVPVRSILEFLRSEKIVD